MNHLILAEYQRTPWALLPSMLATMDAVLTNWALGRMPDAGVMAAIEQDKQARAARREQAAAVSGGGVAVLPLYGIMTQRGNMMSDLSGPGSASTQRFSAALSDALADSSVGGIVIDIDSPGGSVYGVSELAAQIIEGRKTKPIYAVANSLAASAAYWTGASCSELYCTPGGEAGSIGVYTAHTDRSEAMKQAGLHTELISAGKYKTEGNPFGPLTDEARAAVQKSVDNYYGMFVRGVAKGRGVGVDAVRNGFGEGRTLGAEEAHAAGMTDGVATLDEVVKKMQRDIKSSRTSASAGTFDRERAARMLRIMG